MILHIGFYHNELKNLPAKKRWNATNGGEWFVIDNESTDGTAEWLEANGVNHSHFETGGIYDIPALQKEMFRQIDRINPDWIVYLDGDSFTASAYPLNQLVEIADQNGYNQIHFPLVNIFDVGTGERCWGQVCESKDYRFIWKHGLGAKFKIDFIQMSDPKVLEASGLCVNFGGIMGAVKREEELDRRRKAWTLGRLSLSEGAHLREGHEKSWLWKRENLVYCKSMNYFEQIEQLTKEVTNG